MIGVPLLLPPESISPVQQSVGHSPVSCIGWRQWSVLSSFRPVMAQEHWHELPGAAPLHMSLSCAPMAPVSAPEVPDVPELPFEPSTPESATLLPEVPESLLLHAAASAAPDTAATVNA